MKKNCPICLNKTNLFLEKKKQPTKIFPTSNFKGLKKKDLNIYFCEKCQYGFQSPIPNNKQIDQFYLEEQDEYVSLIEKPEIGIDHEIEKINFIKKSIKKQFSKKKEKLKIVEVGGFDGFCIKNIFDPKKSEKILIEPIKKCCKIAKKNGLNTINSYLNTNIAKNYKNYFDIVICKHAIDLFKKSIKNQKKDLENFIKKNFKKNIYIYGASSVVNDIFSTYRVRREKISAIIDSDRKKEKKRLPIVKNLPIYHIKNDKLDKKSAIIISTVDKKAVKNILKDNNFKSNIFNFY